MNPATAGGFDQGRVVTFCLVRVGLGEGRNGYETSRNFLVERVKKAPKVDCRILGGPASS